MSRQHASRARAVEPCRTRLYTAKVGGVDRALLTAIDEPEALAVVRSRIEAARHVGVQLDFAGYAARDVPKGVVLWSLNGGTHSLQEARHG